MTAPQFIDPRYARTTPNPRPIPWDRGPDVRVMADYIRACLRRCQAQERKPQ